MLRNLGFITDDKYFPRHKCKEQNIFMAISEYIAEEYVQDPLVSISHEPTDITLPQTLLK